MPVLEFLNDVIHLIAGLLFPAAAMSDSYFHIFTPLQKDYLKTVCKKRWFKWSAAFTFLHAGPFLFILLTNISLFGEMSFGSALLEISMRSLFIVVVFFPVFITLWFYLLYLLFRKIIPLQRDILIGQKLLRLIPADKYMMREFNQYFIRTSIEQYPFLKINEWAFQQIPDGAPLVLETAPRSAIYLGLRTIENEVILTEQPESIY